MVIRFATSLQTCVILLALPLSTFAAGKQTELTEDVVAHAGLTPQEAVEAMTVPNGFNVRLIAGEPDIHQPIAFAIDERGRLWVVEGHTYPHRIKGHDGAWNEGRDKIVILEDADANGSFETKKIFAENVNLVSGIEVGFGGVWIGAAPYLLFFPDADGDDVPDSDPTVLLDGWGFQDTHETLNAFIWGPDGWLYGCHGVFTHSKVGKPGTPDEQRIPLNAAVWRFHPTRHEFEVFAWGTSNPWGVDFNDRGQQFITACVIPHLYHMIQGGRYQRQGGHHFNPYVYDDIKTIADHFHYLGPNPHGGNNKSDAAGGGHAHCGGMIYLGDAWPEKYRNTLLMNNVHGNRVNNDSLERKGSGYVGKHEDDFLRANDKHFRGINLKYGPDGNAYLIDWYDPRACHGGDHSSWQYGNGRVFKVSYGRERHRNVDLSRSSDIELVKLHLHANEWYVRMARRILQERGPKPAVHEALAQMLHGEQDVTNKLRALWTLHATGGADDALLERLLRHDDEYLRSWAIQLLLEDKRVTSEQLTKLETLAAKDPSPVVRLYLASAMQRLPVEQRWGIADALVSHAEDAADHNLPLMVWYGVEPLVVHDTAKALELSRTSKLEQVSRFIVRRAAADEKAIAHLLADLAHTSDEAAQLMVLGEIVNSLKGRAKVAMPDTWKQAYARLSSSDNEKVREQADFIAIQYGDERVFPKLRELLVDSSADMSKRQWALEGLLSVRDEDAIPLYQQVLGTPPLREGALKGLAQHADSKTPDAILAVYSELDAGSRNIAISTLVSRPAFAAALLDAIEAERVPREHIQPVTARQIHKLGDEALIEQLDKVWGTIRETPEEKAQQMKKYRELLKDDFLKQANRTNGRAVFAKTCGACHRLFDAGGKIGPDLTGSNRKDLGYLLENLVDPSAVVGANYRLWIAEMDDGRIVSGLIANETDSAVTIQTQTESEVLPRDEIIELRQSQLSMMPEDQLSAMSPEEVRDLIAYLRGDEQTPLPPEQAGE